MELSEEEFKKIAHLSRLEFSVEEKESIKKSMNEFVGYLDKLKNLNTENTKPMMRVDESVKDLREDIPLQGLTSEEALKNAPQTGSGQFSIPKTVK